MKSRLKRAKRKARLARRWPQPLLIGGEHWFPVRAGMVFVWNATRCYATEVETQADPSGVVTRIWYKRLDNESRVTK